MPRDDEQDVPSATRPAEQAGQQRTDVGRSDQADVPVRELILRLAQVEDALHAAPHQIYGSDGLTDGLVALLARERDIIAELRSRPEARDPSVLSKSESRGLQLCKGQPELSPLISAQPRPSRAQSPLYTPRG